MKLIHILNESSRKELNLPPFLFSSRGEDTVNGGTTVLLNLDQHQLKLIRKINVQKLQVNSEQWKNFDTEEYNELYTDISYQIRRYIKKHLAEDGWTLISVWFRKPEKFRVRWLLSSLEEQIG